MSAAVEFRNVDILFGLPNRGGVRERALGMLDDGRTRSEIASATGVVLGVTGASLAVEQGEISVLMGLSGSGKSTLLRAANGLNRVTRGQVLVRHGSETVDVASCDARTLRHVRMERVAMVFQQFALLPWRTVRQNVGLGLELRGIGTAERRRIVDEKLKLVGLDQWADRYASELSGGMQQRVGLARAFATDADILLMDEPFSALDPLIRTKLQDELLALQATVKKTILFVSHDLDEAMKLGNTISIMEGGRIVQTGTPEDIVLTPADDYVAEFVKHMNPLNVLKGASVMRPAHALDREGEGVWLDAERRHYVALDTEGRAATAMIDGVAYPVVQLHDVAAIASLPSGMVMLPADAPLRLVLQTRQRTGYPVLLGEQGRVHGVCSESEILQGLTGIAAPSKQGPPSSPVAVRSATMHNLADAQART